MIRELEFKYLCRRHSDEIYRYARSLLGNRADAEDATQEALLRLWDNLPKVQLFNSRAWVLRTTRNYCLDQIRRRSSRFAPVFVGDKILTDQPDELATDPSGVANSNDLRGHIDNALQELPETLKSVFILYEINGLRYREIAETLDMPINTVKGNLSRARKKLSELLANHNPWTRTYKD